MISPGFTQNQVTGYCMLLCVCNFSFCYMAGETLSKGISDQHLSITIESLSVL